MYEQKQKNEICAYNMREISVKYVKIWLKSLDM